MFAHAKVLAGTRRGTAPAPCQRGLSPFDILCVIIPRGRCARTIRSIACQASPGNNSRHNRPTGDGRHAKKSPIGQARECLTDPTDVNSSRGQPRRPATLRLTALQSALLSSGTGVSDLPFRPSASGLPPPASPRVADFDFVCSHSSAIMPSSSSWIGGLASM